MKNPTQRQRNKTYRKILKRYETNHFSCGICTMIAAVNDYRNYQHNYPELALFRPEPIRAIWFDTIEERMTALGLMIAMTT